ncbi:MAG TPA: GNAT family N-acetyltransferase [Thermoplasmata archaeon]|nr:GNAT family N-acetyltransferase [Thermoplasmata archaeon]
MPSRRRQHGASIYRLRAATVRDLPTLVRHRLAMFADIRATASDLLARHGRTYRAWVRPLMARGEVVGVVAETPNGEVVASGCVWFQPTQPRVLMPRPRAPYIMSMYTQPDHRGHRIATRIVERLIREARRRRYPRVTLHASDQGRRVYARLGFEGTSEMRLWLDKRVERVMRGPRRRG